MNTKHTKKVYRPPTGERWYSDADYYIFLYGGRKDLPDEALITKEQCYTSDFQNAFKAGLRSCENHAYRYEWHVSRFGEECRHCKGAN